MEFSVNWKKIILDLIKQGFTQDVIADECGCSQPSISAIASGATKNPQYSIGEKLVAMHATYVQKPRLRKAAVRKQK